MTGRLQTVYFMRQKGVARGPIKIGCSTYVPQRLDELSVWSPVPLEVIATFPGGFHEERRVHSAFWSDHSHHEWFNWSQKLEDLIQTVAAGAFDIASLPKPQKRSGPSRKWSPQQRACMMVYHEIAKLRREGIRMPFGVYESHIRLPRDDPKKKAIVAFLADPQTYGVTPEEWNAAYNREAA